jgi:hypothetical protein
MAADGGAVRKNIVRANGACGVIVFADLFQHG